MEQIRNIFNMLIPYGRAIHAAGIILLALALLLSAAVCGKLIAEWAGKKSRVRKEDMLTMDVSRIPQQKKGLALRYMLAADGIDPNPLSYLPIMDGGTERYARSFTVSALPKYVDFAKTFSVLFDFPGCISSVFVTPLSDAHIERMLDHEMDVLESEYSLAENNVNRRRKLRPKIRDVNSWAEQVETGSNRIFDVGFLLTLYAESIPQLNTVSDSFHAKALERSIHISCCYGLQAEAYALNGPYNRAVQVFGKKADIGCVHYMRMDKYAVSALWNYTQSSYTHRTGVLLGRDMITRDPVIFDQFAPSHDSFSIGIFGGTGSGKSTAIKCMALRGMLQGVHYVVIDGQVRKGLSEGEYASLAAAFGVNFRISKDSGDTLNLFDISESLTSARESATMIHEERTLDLSGKVSSLVDMLCSIITISSSAAKKERGGQFDSLAEEKEIVRILTDLIALTYADFGIRDGEPDSLYEKGSLQGGGFSSGHVKKSLPTLSDFYKRLIRAQRNNRDSALALHYRTIANALKDYVRELYYAKNSLTFFTREQYERLPEDGEGRKYYPRGGGAAEEVEAVRGIKPYYDGQSTFSISKDVFFTNMDFSTLPEADRPLARQICISFVTENFVKRNSEKMDASSCLCVIYDEAHELLPNPYARKTIDVSLREARKRHVGIMLSSQTVREFDVYPETQAMLKMMAVKFVFRQDVQDRQYLIDTLGITESQAMKIVTQLGGTDRDDRKKRHKGECCIIDGKEVCFCKIDYLAATEGIFVETDVRELEKMIHVSRGA